MPTSFSDYNEHQEYQIPSFAKAEAYNFGIADNDSMTVYQELSAISEEIEQCRLRNC